MSPRSTAQVLWVAFIALVLIYVAVAYMVSVLPSALPVRALTLALWVTCGILLVSAVWIYRRFLSPELVRKYSIEPLERAGISPGSPEGGRLFRFSAERWVLRIHLITWAIAEAVALLGLVAALIATRPGAILPFAVASILVILRFRPDFSVVDSLAPPNSPRG